MKKPACTHGCNDAEFLLINGDVKEYLCEPSLEDRLVDLVTNNDTVTFHSSDADKNGIRVIEVS